MYKVHGYLNGEMVINWRMEHLPRNGDTVRFAPGMHANNFAKVTEVIWCMDEKSDEGQRVNLRMESLKDTQGGSNGS